MFVNLTVDIRQFDIGTKRKSNPISQFYGNLATLRSELLSHNVTLEFSQSQENVQ